MTDELGTYRFDNLSSGNHVVIPDFTGLSFSPPQVSAGSGSSATDIVAATMDLNDADCDKMPAAVAVIAADVKAATLRDFGLERADISIVRAMRGRNDGERDALIKSLTKGSRDIRDAFTVLSALSREFPKVVADCAGREECSAVSFETTIRRYRKTLDRMRRLAFFILRRSRETLGGTTSSKERRLMAKIRSLHKGAVRSLRALPRTSDRCEPSGATALG